MKNFIIMGLVALLLFAISFALSIWLKDSKSEEGADKKDAKKTSKDHGGKEKEDDLHPIVRPGVGSDDPTKLASSFREQLAALKSREDRVERRQTQIDLLLQDIRSERESLDGLRKQIDREMKLVAQKMVEVETQFTQLDKDREASTKRLDEVSKKLLEYDKTESKNLTRVSAMSDSMSPESAAAIIQQLAEGGKMDMAVKLLAGMAEKKAAKVLDVITDSALSAQLLTRMLSLKRATPMPMVTPSPM